MDAHTINDLTWRVVLNSAMGSYTLETAESILINSYHINEKIKICLDHNYRIGPCECRVVFFSFCSETVLFMSAHSSFPPLPSDTQTFTSTQHLQQTRSH